MLLAYYVDWIKRIRGEWPVLKYIWYSHRLTWSAVDLFFVLSGFLIVGILIDMKDSKFYFKTFYIRRICRIFPLYYLMVLLYIIIPLLDLQWTQGLFEGRTPLYGYLSFTQNFFLDISFISLWMGVTWSLAVEEQFYILIPLLVKFVSRKKLLLIFGCAICMAPIFRFTLEWYAAYILPFARSDSILMGGCIAIAIRNVRLREILIVNYRFIVFLFLFFLLGAAIWPTSHLSFGRPLIHLWLGILYSLFIVVIILNRSSNLSLVLKHNLLVWFGFRSFAIYLFHTPTRHIVYNGLVAIIPLTSAHYIDWLTPVVSLIIVLILSELSFRYYEKRFLLFGKSFKY